MGTGSLFSIGLCFVFGYNNRAVPNSPNIYKFRRIIQAEVVRHFAGNNGYGNHAFQWIIVVVAMARDLQIRWERVSRSVAIWVHCAFLLMRRSSETPHINRMTVKLHFSESYFFLMSEYAICSDNYIFVAR